MQVWEKVKTYALTPILGVPAFVVVAVAAAGAYLCFGRKKGRSRGLFR
jgi:multisubunit Na+/H+ antiporter MnhB subunit